MDLGCGVQVDEAVEEGAQEDGDELFGERAGLELCRRVLAIRF